MQEEKQTPKEESKKEAPKKEEPKKEPKKETAKETPKEAPAAAPEKSAEAKADKTKKINQMSLKELDKKLEEVKAKMGNLQSKYAAELLKRKKEIMGGIAKNE